MSKYRIELVLLVFFLVLAITGIAQNAFCLETTQPSATYFATRSPTSEVE